MHWRTYGPLVALHDAFAECTCTAHMSKLLRWAERMNVKLIETGCVQVAAGPVVSIG